MRRKTRSSSWGTTTLIRFSAWFLFFFITFTQSGQAPLLAQSELKPQIEIKDPEYNFGMVAEGTRVKHDFVVRNAGTSDLVIEQVIPGCGCTAATPKDKVLQPGKETVIQVEFDTSGFSGEKKKATRINSNDPTNPSTFIQMRGVIERGITVEPARVVFGEVSRGAAEQPTMEVVVRAKSGIRIGETLYTGRALEVRDISSSEHEKRLSISVRQNLGLGEIRERVVVAVDGPQGKDQVNIPVLGMVKSTVRLKPNSVAVGIIEGQALIERAIQIENAGKKPLTIKSVNSDHAAVSASVKTIQEGKTFVLKVQVDPRQVTKELRATVTIETDNPDESTVPVGVYGILPLK